MKTSMSLSAKIISLILLFCLTSLASGLYSISSMASIGKKIHNLSTVEIPLQNQVAKISEHQLNQELALTGAALNLELDEIEKYKMHLRNFHQLNKVVAKELELAETLIRSTVDTLNPEENNIDTSTMAQVQDDLGQSVLTYNNILKSLELVGQKHDEYAIQSSKFIELLEHTSAQSQDTRFARIQRQKVLVQLEETQKHLDTHLSKLRDTVQKISLQAMIEAEETEKSALRVTVLIISSSLFISLSIGIWIAVNIRRRLRETIISVDQISDGNLTVKNDLSSNDEIGSVMRAISKNQKNLVAIGTSTGGTSALMSVLSALPRTCPGIVAVVHMPSSFTKAFADRLDTLCSIDVLEATNHLPVRQGQAIIACGGKHLEVQKRGAGYWVKVTQGDLVNGHCPSVDRLFFSVATAAKQHGMGILMTGMGRDGAQGLLRIKDAGGITVAQDETTSVVFGMPKAAIDLGASDKVVKLQDIAAEILHP